jgi:hypothetical protein
MGEIPETSQDQGQRRASDRKRAAAPTRRVVPIVASHGRSLERVDLNVHATRSSQGQPGGLIHSIQFQTHRIGAEGRFRDALLIFPRPVRPKPCRDFSCLGGYRPKLSHKCARNDARVTFKPLKQLQNM